MVKYAIAGRFKKVPKTLQAHSTHPIRVSAVLLKFNGGGCIVRLDSFS